MRRLASPIATIKEHYTVVVIGSGYGGGISASRMARAGQKVCVLERGKEILPGEFPDTLLEANEEMQFDTAAGKIGSDTGLFNFHVNSEINVLVGCGLGGTSLINANVALEPDPRVFNDPRWPQAIRDDLADGLKQGYDRACAMLRPNPYPDNFPELRKTAAHAESGKYMYEKFYKPPIAVTFDEFDEDLNHVGVSQTPCVLCGDCVTGCNHTSKNTVQMNYLPDAWNHGAEIFTETKVRYIEKKDDKWLVHFELLGAGREAFDAPEQFVSADIVILAAGTLGSTEILLRSRAEGLALSDKLGKHFSGNGDVLGFGYNCDQPINGVGWGNRAPDPEKPVGPCITGIIDTRASAEDYRQGMSIEEGSFPGALSAILPLSFSALAKLLGRDTDEGVIDYLGEKKRELESLVRGSYHGAMDNTQIYLIMTYDSGDGEMYLDEDRLRISWPGVGSEPIFEQARARLQEATKALGGTFIRNPIWTELFGHDLITVHPLGGCCIADAAEEGVTNHKGQVFSGKAGSAVHEGLYVADGAIIPTPVGTNPFFTISALAERNAALIAREHNWDISYDLPSRPTRQVKAAKPGIRFTEKMTGYFSTNEKEDFARAYERGRIEMSPFSFTLTVISDDLEQMLNSPQHQARMTGTVDAPTLSRDPLTVSDGLFNLFVKHPDEVNTRLMRYWMRLTSEEGTTYFFHGDKIIHDDEGFDIWSDTTTLYITLYEGPNAQSPILGRGMLKIRPADFAKQLTTLSVTNVSGLGERLKYQARFGEFFAGVLFNTYGGIVAGSRYFDPSAAPRKQRPLRVTPPEVHELRTEDKVGLRLTRYRGGDKGPVILSHGLGVSSRIFSIDTIECNLLEYLFAHRYDVWLLDYRASIELPAAATQFSADDIARYDYPAAVAKVRALTGAESVQMVVHCFGSTSWTMSMLGGWLQGVRSAVCSQVVAHFDVPLLTKLKTGLHVPSILEKLGVDSLTAYVDERSDWEAKLFDKALRLWPMDSEERAANPVHNRIAFLYGTLYELDQLNQATFDALHELFGVANIESFQHLALLARKAELRSLDGANDYLPHVERLALPMTIISGGENECFLPSSTQRSYDWLREHNGKSLYKRYVVPAYGHIDCIFGKHAVRDVYPTILQHLEETNH